MDGWIALVIGIPVSVILAFSGIYLTNRATRKEGENTAIAIRDTTASMIKAEREAGVKCIETDIRALAKESNATIEAVVKAIQASGEKTLKSIEKDGAATRRSIEGIHESIKKELRKNNEQ